MQIAIRRAYLPPNWEIICAIVLITKGQRRAATELSDNDHQKHTRFLLYTHTQSPAVNICTDLTAALMPRPNRGCLLYSQQRFYQTDYSADAASEISCTAVMNNTNSFYIWFKLISININVFVKKQPLFVCYCPGSQRGHLTRVCCCLCSAGRERPLLDSPRDLEKGLDGMHLG